MRQVLEDMTKNRKVQVLALLLVALAAMDVAFYLLRTAPAAARESSMEEKIEGLRGKIQETEGECALYGSYEDGRRQIEEFKALLPRRSEFVQVVNRIYRMAKDDGMKASSITTDVKGASTSIGAKDASKPAGVNGPGPGGLVQLKFKMPVTGSYRDARKFISDIESSPMFLSIDNLSMTTTPDGSINFTLSLSTYMRS